LQPIGKDSPSRRAHHRAPDTPEETAVPSGSPTESPNHRPRPHGPGLSRRSFLARGAVSAAAFPTLAAFLEACSKSKSSGGGSAPSATFSVASPEHPVKWEIAADNKPIADSLPPEQNATVNIYTYTDYLDPQALKDFEKKYKQYNVKCSITTFEDTTEALGKIRSGGVQADIFNPSYDQMGKLVKGGLVAPLNHSYIPNIQNVWPSFQNPFYDQGWQYTTPYTVYTTGIAWRTDKVSEDIGKRANPYDVFWDPQYARKLSVLDDYHTTMGMVAMRNGMDINTSKKSDLDKIQQQLTQMNKTTAPKVNVTDYQDIPTGVVNLCHAWSGDAFNMVSYMPQGQSPDVLRYWFPADDPHKGEVDNDLLVMLKMTKNPVMTHLFLNHMLDYTVAFNNFMFTGYQPPQTRITPSKLVSDGTIPANLATVVVEEELFQKGQRLLELEPTVDAQWQAIWQQFKAGA
jgi:spermidine/putrescine transport system substrate-binding protein